MKKASRKDKLNFVKGVPMTCVNFVVIEVNSFWEKKYKALISFRSSYKK
jgi:hypothetical protein